MRGPRITKILDTDSETVAMIKELFWRPGLGLLLWRMGGILSIAGFGGGYCESQVEGEAVGGVIRVLFT